MLTAPHPRGVLLDAGNTLVFVDPEILYAAFRKVGLPVHPERFPEAEFQARSRLVEKAGEVNSGTESIVWREYFVQMLLALGVPPGRLEEVGAILQEVHQQDHLWTRVEAGTREALERLTKTGYRLGVVSNSDGRVEDLLTRLDLREHLDFVLDSGVMGVEKPDPRIFQEGCRLLGLPPEECLYVGDLFPVDIQGAWGAGLQAVLMDPLDRWDVPADRVASVRELPEYLEKRRLQGA
ncbi:MAG: HAD-IA family hydrolase [Gemmatimonadota bacterium]